MFDKIYLFICLTLVCSVLSVRINFTNCYQSEWSCSNSDPSEIVYTCALVKSNDFIIHLKDFYNNYTISVTVQNCKDLRVVLDCPILQKSSKLQQFKIKECDRLEFITLSSGSLIQTPPEFVIENVRKIVAFPNNIFKSPTTTTELKCMGASSLKKIRVVNSKINTIETKAIYNVSGIKSIEFENVTINNIATQALDVAMGYNKTYFMIANSKIENLSFKAIAIQSATVKLYNNDFGDFGANVINITADYVSIQGNDFKEINAYGITTNAVKTDINDNVIKYLKTNALANIKCAKKHLTPQKFSFSKNVIENVETNSLYLDYSSCKLINTQVAYHENKINCRCRDIAFLNSNNDLNDIIMNISNKNTCLLSACNLPIDIVKLLLENDMCHLNLDPQVMCLLYNDKHTNNNEVTTDEEITEAESTFYLIRQANSLHGDASAAMIAFDKDDLIKDSHRNMTNRTTIKVIFDSSKDFVETLRSTNRANKKVTETVVASRDEYTNRCTGGKCRNTVSYDKQKALDFYKYVYAQLRTPQEDNSKN